MKKVLILILIVLFNIVSKAQCSKVWEKKRDFGISLVTGSYLAYRNNCIYNLVSHSTFSIIYYGGGETRLYKYSSAGDSIWLFKTNYTYPNGFISDPLGNSYYSGNRYQKYVFSDYYLVKADSAGKLGWTKGQEYKKQTFLNSILFDNNFDILMLTEDNSKVKKLTKINKSGVVLWENFLDNGKILDIKVDSKNHIHFLYPNYIIELEDNGYFKKLVVLDSMANSGFGNILASTFKLIENGNDFYYLVYTTYSNNNFILDKIDKNGNISFGKKQSNSINLDHSDHAFLEILPDNSILFGGLIDTSSLEGGKVLGPSDVFYLLNPDGSEKFKKILYSKSNLTDLKANDQYIFSMGYGKDSTYYVDIHDFNGNRYCDVIKLSYKERPISLLPTNGTEFYITTYNNDDYNHKFSKLYKYNENFVSTSELPTTKLRIYPNPSLQSISIKGIDIEKEIHFTISDIMGNVVERAKLFNEGNINIENLSNGIYFITIENGIELQVLKFVKQ